MAFITNILAKHVFRIEEKLLYLSVPNLYTQFRERHTINPKPRLRNPTWLTKKNRVVHNEFITSDNQEFLKEVVQDQFKIEAETSLKKEHITNIEWTPNLKRTGVIARKIGIYPIWLKNGEKVLTTLLQVLDNHVIKYYTPEEYNPPRKRIEKIYNKKGVILLGAGSTDPSTFTKEYCGIFRDTGVLPKKHLARFFVSPEGILPPGTPIGVLHYQVGNYVDVRGKTIDRGFQGVMKRHGFKGMPRSHGVTKTHRRGGNIGGGGEKARVWPGTRMPGHMGNEYRVNRGLKILRINTKFNVLWVTGQAIPGETNSIVTIYDSLLPLRKPKKALPFPTLIDPQNADFPEDIFDEDVHCFDSPSIEYIES
nr:39S ribosomal protein L3, mitochondrial [Onthophagus taurus]